MASPVPRRIDDPFAQALARVAQAAAGKRGELIHFGAKRQTVSHNGIDLMVPSGTPIQAPAPRVVLIGMCRESERGPGASIGNGLVFFVPDERQPHFLLLAHLSPRTFTLLRRHGVPIGSEIVRESGEDSVVALSGASRAGPAPHVHVTAATTFMHGGTIYSAQAFMERYRQDRGAFLSSLRKTNFQAIMPRTRYGDPRSLEGYLDPLVLARGGSLRFSSLPEPALLARSEEKASRAAMRQ